VLLALLVLVAALVLGPARAALMVVAAMPLLVLVSVFVFAFVL